MTPPVSAESSVYRSAHVTLAACFALVAFVLWLEGRPWWCACGSFNPITLDAFGKHNSQHLLDPYSITHVAKGILLAGLLAWAWPKLPMLWSMAFVAAAEGLWEVIENSPFVIERYRTATIAQGYQGDTILNSLGDIASCVLGYCVARSLGKWPSIAAFVISELLLLWWIRDNLTLSTLMLIAPLEPIKAWQEGGR